MSNRPAVPDFLVVSCRAGLNVPRGSAGPIGTNCPTLRGREFLFFDDRRGNVYENKGAAWKTELKSGNVFENKAT